MSNCCASRKVCEGFLMSICQNTKQAHLLLLEKWQYAVIEKIRHYQRVLSC